MYVDDDFEETTPEARARMSEAIEEIVDTCEEICETPSESISALSGALACIICEHVDSKDSAVMAIQMFANAVLAIVQGEEADNNVAWRQQRH